MAKTSGLGDNLYVGGQDVSGDVGSISKITATNKPIEVTGINKNAMERLYGLRDGSIDYAGYFNKLGAHAELSLMPTADTLVTYCRGTAIGNPAASCNAKQLNYDWKRDNKGGLDFSVTADADAFGLEWGVQLTPGVRTDSTATNGASFDNLAALAFGAQAYLQAMAVTGTSFTVTVQHSTDNSTWSTLVAFAPVTVASTFQRVVVANTTTVNRFLRVITTGTFTVASFAVAVTVNPILGTVF